MLKYCRFLLLYPLLACAALGNWVGGVWMWTGVVLLAVLALIGDDVLPRDSSTPLYQHTALLDVMLYFSLPLIGVMYLGLLTSSFEQTGVFNWIGGVLSTGFLVGIAATNIAHELMHRRSPLSELYSKVLLTFSFDLPLVISHLYGHHVTVGLPQDHATARRNESSYAFIWRSTMKGNLNAFHTEAKRLRAQGVAVWSWRNRFIRGHLLSVCMTALAGLLAGWQGVLLFLVCAVLSKSILELINYIQHYGLVRVEGAPIDLRHSWNSDAVISASLLFNLTRHSHHHADPQCPYWALKSFEKAPNLPRGYLTSICLALIPPVWKKHMARPLANWDANHATQAERDLLCKQSLAMETT